MAQFTVNAQRFDPYKNFKFLVKWDNKTVAGVSKCSAFSRTTEPVEHREGGDPSTTEFEAWANKVWNYGSGLGAEVSLENFRKNIRIELLNEAGQVAIAYNVYRCWVSEFQALPELDASANAVAIQTLKLENEGWVRDSEVSEPAEPSFS